MYIGSNVQDAKPNNVMKQIQYNTPCIVIIICKIYTNNVIQFENNLNFIAYQCVIKMLLYVCSLREPPLSPERNPPEPEKTLSFPVFTSDSSATQATFDLHPGRKLSRRYTVAISVARYRSALPERRTHIVEGGIVISTLMVHKNATTFLLFYTQAF